MKFSPLSVKSESLTHIIIKAFENMEWRQWCRNICCFIAMFNKLTGQVVTAYLKGR